MVCYSRIAIICIGVALVLSACSSSPGIPESTEPQVSVRLVGENDLSRYGVPISEDPLSFSTYNMSSLTNKRMDFVVCSIELYLPEDAHVLVGADVLSATGESIASLCSLDDMKAYWHRAVVEEKYRQPRINNLNRYYFPSFNLQVKKGRHVYYLACKGQSPLPRPAKAEVFITIGDGEIQTYEFNLPEKSAPAQKKN
jgi:hypothetical protein